MRVRERERDVQAKNAASDLLAFVEAFLRVRILLLAPEELQVLRFASQPYVPRRRHQHRRRRDRLPARIHRATRTHTRHPNIPNSPNPNPISLALYQNHKFNRKKIKNELVSL